jgi:hypothetical protein
LLRVELLTNQRKTVLNRLKWISFFENLKFVFWIPLSILANFNTNFDELIKLHELSKQRF